ncbi:SAM-dependent methyltransferase [Microbacterium sp.]|uniref:SAM-dependent methyltransferase n=1 Tax=Microbacterium sp. TaxID=51671 RepID=UPI003C71ABD6
MTTGTTTATTAPGSGYDRMGEFHDLFMDEPHRRLRPALEAAFGDRGPDDIVLDLGAGSGLGVRQLAQATCARIVAVEPSLTMRAVMLARIADDADLTDRVSVIAGAVPEVFDQLPDRIAGFVCAHMLGHLTPAVRSQTLAALAERLAPDGVGVVTVNAPATTDSEPAATAPRPAEPVTEERVIGAHRYVARHYPSGPDGASFSAYEVQDGNGRVLRAARFASDWTTITADTLRAELASSGDAQWVLVPHAQNRTLLLLTRVVPSRSSQPVTAP